METSSWTSLLKWFIYIGIFALLCTPFVVADSLYFPFITGKAFFFRITVELMFGAWLILSVFDTRYFLKKSWLVASFALFLVVIFISNCFGENPTASFWSNFERMEGFVTLIHLFMLVLVIGSLLREKTDWNVLVHGSVITSIFMVVQAFNQIADKGFGYRIDTTLGNPIYLAIYMLFNSFLSLWLIAQIDVQRIRDYFKSIRFWLYILAWISQVVIVFQTQTRGAMLGVIGGIFIALVLIAIFAKNERPVRVASFSILAIMCIMFAGIYFGRNSEFVRNIPSLHRLVTISASEGTGQARLWNWGIAWQGIKERPLLGWGQSNYNFVFDKYYDPRMVEQEPWFDRTHNILLDWLIAGGFIGLIAYLSIICSTLWLIWKKLSATVFEKSLLIGLIAGYFIHNLFVFDNIISYIWFGFVIAYVYSQTSIELDWFREKVSSNMQALLIVAICIVTPYTIYAVNWNPYIVARDTISAIQLFVRDGDKLLYKYPSGLDDNLNLFKKVITLDTFANPEIRTRLLASGGELMRIKNIPEQTRNNFIKFAEDEMARQIESVPNDARYPYLLAADFTQSQQYDDALTQINKAISLSSQRQIFYFSRARIYLMKGDMKLAVDSARSGYNMAPQFDSAWAQYAAILGSADPAEFQIEINNQIADKNFRRVERFILENLARNPTVLSGYVSLSALHFQMNEIEKSIAVLDDAIVKIPTAKLQLEKLKTQILSGQNPVGKSF